MCTGHGARRAPPISNTKRHLVYQQLFLSKSTDGTTKRQQTKEHKVANEKIK